MAAVQIIIHKDRLPRPVKAVRGMLARIAAASPISIKVEKPKPIVAFIAFDAAGNKVQPEMDGSPGLPGELEVHPHFADADCL